MTANSENFLQFLEKIVSQKETDNPHQKIISYASLFSPITFSNIVNNLNHKKTTFFYWEKPDENYSILGIDELYSVSSYGENRTEISKNEIEKWVNNFENNYDSLGLKSIPLFMGGMKFSAEGHSKDTIWNDFADSDWFIPKIILLMKDGQHYIVHNFIFEQQSYAEISEIIRGYEDTVASLLVDYSNGTKETVLESNLFNDEEKDEWIQKVNSALSQISNGAYKKIVLSRRISLKLSQTPVLFNKLKSLAQDYPRCYIFAYGKKESVFFGASPEKLAKISNGWVEADALAGSTPRGISPEEDEKLADELLMSKKNLNEQYAVVDFITNSFSGFSDNIVYDSKPVIRKLSNIQHLWTPIKAKLNSGHTIFSILKEIHPTPAICGVPWSGALDFIRATEGYNRGLYAGIVGWFNFDEQGEFAVSIRSALIKNTDLFAFAGCGIVEGSDPELEFEETELKLKPILSLFPHEKICQS